MKKALYLFIVLLGLGNISPLIAAAANDPQQKSSARQKKRKMVVRSGAAKPAKSVPAEKSKAEKEEQLDIELIKAVRNNAPQQTLLTLIEQGANPKKPDDHPYTDAVNVAIIRGGITALDTFNELGYINVTDPGNKIYSIVTVPPTLSWFINNGLSPNWRSGYGTALMIAAQYNAKAVKILLHADADPDLPGDGTIPAGTTNPDPTATFRSSLKSYNADVQKVWADFQEHKRQQRQEIHKVMKDVKQSGVEKGDIAHPMPAGVADIMGDYL